VFYHLRNPTTIKGFHLCSRNMIIYAITGNDLLCKTLLVKFSLFKIKMVPLRQITLILLKSTNNGKKNKINK
jgi:hypothetical protein